MHATHIVIHQKKIAAKSVAISRMVERIGYGDSYHVSLSESLDRQGLVATLRKTPEGWRIYNRSDHPLRIGKRTVPVAEQSHWPEGGTLVVDDATTLTLQIQSASNPQNDGAETELPTVDQPSDTDVEWDNATDHPTDAERIKKKSNAGSVVGLAVCGLVLSVMAAAKLKGPAVTSSAPSLAVILELAAKAESESAAKARVADARQLAAEIQIARAALVRGDKRTAIERFTELRTYLAPQRDRFMRDQAELEIEATRYVEFQLERLR